MGKLEDFYAGFQQLLESPQWKTDPNYRAQKIVELGEVRSKLTEGYYEKLIALIATSLNLSNERIDAALGFHDIADVHAALNPVLKEQPPDELFPRTGWISDYLRWTSGNEVPLQWHFWCGLAAMAAACRRNLVFDAGAFKVLPNLYLMIVENSASKKSTAINMARKTIERLNQLVKKRYPTLDHLPIPLAASSGTIPKFIENIRSKQVISENILGETSTKWSDACALISADDLVTLFSKHSFASERWVEVLTHMWDYEGEWEDATLSRDNVLLMNPCITFIGGTTTEWLRNNVTEAMIGGGWLSRVIYCIHPGGSDPEKLHSWAKRLDPVEGFELAERLMPLTAMSKRVVEPTPEYYEWYDEWYREYVPRMDQTADPKLAAYYKRRPTMLHKIAMLLAVNEFLGNKRQDFTVTLEDGLLADKIMTREEANLPSAFSGAVSHPEAQRINRIYAYMVKRDEPVPHTELLRAVYEIVGNADNFRRDMNTLIEMGEVERYARTDGHRGWAYRLCLKKPKKLSK